MKLPLSANLMPIFLSTVTLFLLVTAYYARVDLLMGIIDGYIFLALYSLYAQLFAKKQKEIEDKEK
jgi:Ca2+/Na+ antiporter